MDLDVINYHLFACGPIQYYRAYLFPNDIIKQDRFHKY